MSESAPPGLPGLVPLDRLQAIQAEYLHQLSALFQHPSQAAQAQISRDRRFHDPAWLSSPYFSVTAALYLANQRALMALAGAAVLDRKAKQRLEFLVQQMTEAASPANFWATNPEAQALFQSSQGESLRRGIDNLLQDLSKGRMTQSDETAYAVGENLAITPGQVVLKTELFELIQYQPSTERVGRRPLLMVPPMINKFYILDLQAHNSFVRHAVSQGNTVFMLSWRNPGPEMGHLRWDDYLDEGVIRAIDAVLDITDQDDLNLLGFCVGGTLVATALSVLAARHRSVVASLTLLTTLVDFQSAGVLDVFIDEAHVSLRESTIGKAGLMMGSELASTFSVLRPADLVWSYVTRNYLKGQTPPAFDILFWNADSTNLPGPLFAWYLRNTYLENRLITPGGVSLCQHPISLMQAQLPVYSFGAREDHIVPWQSAWRSAQVMSQRSRFVLGASGHVAGTINPVSSHKRSYWTNPRLGRSAEDWLHKAEEHPGSWWSDWTEWLAQHQGGQRAAPKRLGSKSYPPLAPAPGDYVRVRSEQAAARHAQASPEPDARSKPKPTLKEAT